MRGWKALKPPRQTTETVFSPWFACRWSLSSVKTISSFNCAWHSYMCIFDVNACITVYNHLSICIAAEHGIAADRTAQATLCTFMQTEVWRAMDLAVLKHRILRPRVTTTSCCLHMLGHFYELSIYHFACYSLANSVKHGTDIENNEKHPRAVNT